MKLPTSFLLWIVFALVGGATGCVLEDFPETSSPATDQDAGSSDGSDSSCDPTACNAEAPPGANGSCVDGSCKYRCESVFDDSNDDPSDGCDIDTRSVDSCGPQHRECPSNQLNLLPICERNSDGVYQCDVDTTQCREGYRMDNDNGCTQDG